MVFFKTSWNTLSNLKVFLLRVFGATVGKKVVLKPNINIKYPWNLVIGNHCWIGEGVWIDNLDQVTLEDHVCISQGAFLECGNHNYKSSSFDLMTAPIYVKQGSWIGAKGIIGPGVTVGTPQSEVRPTYVQQRENGKKKPKPPKNGQKLKKCFCENVKIRMQFFSP